MQDGPLKSCAFGLLLGSELLLSIQTLTHCFLMKRDGVFPVACCAEVAHGMLLLLQPAATANCRLGGHVSPAPPTSLFLVKISALVPPRVGEQLGNNTKILRNTLSRKGFINIVLILYKTA